MALLKIIHIYNILVKEEGCNLKEAWGDIFESIYVRMGMKLHYPYIIDSLLSFLNFNFDPGGLVIDFSVTRQTHMLADILSSELGFQLANLRL